MKLIKNTILHYSKLQVFIVANLSEVKNLHTTKNKTLKPFIIVSPKPSFPVFPFKITDVVCRTILTIKSCGNQYIRLFLVRSMQC